MGMYNFMMSCGHQAKREVADPAKYYNIDREYYSKQGLCDKCWDRLKTDKEKSKNNIYNELPSRGKVTTDGEYMKNCILCGGKTYMFYHENKKYEGRCMACGNSIKFTHKNIDDAIRLYNAIKGGKQ